MPDLHIPDRAMQAAVEGLQPITVDSRDIEAVLWSAGPVVMAVELRRLADRWVKEVRKDWLYDKDDPAAHELREAIVRLHKRADELDPPRS